MIDQLEKHRELATALQLYGIACPNLVDGDAFTIALGQLDDVIRADDTPPTVKAAFTSYYAGLLEVAAVWLAQKHLKLGRLSARVAGSQELLS